MSRSFGFKGAALLIPLAITALAAQQPTPTPAPTPAPPPASVAAPAAAPATTPAVTAPAAASAAAPAGAMVPAAPPPSPSELQKQIMDFLLRGITLSPEQKTKLDSTLAAHREDRMAFGTAVADSATMAARIKIVRRHMAQNRALLTEEQQKIYDKNFAELRSIFTPQ